MEYRLSVVIPELGHIESAGGGRGSGCRPVFSVQDLRDRFGHILQLVSVVPQCVEGREELRGFGRVIRLNGIDSPDTTYNHNGVDYAADVAEQLSAALGRRVRLIEGRSAGRIELSFYGADDREALIEDLKTMSRRKAGRE